LDKKNYYPIFKLTGFTGFDGSFKNWSQVGLDSLAAAAAVDLVYFLVLKFLFATT
jgi:hypothetical protein